MDVWFDSGSSWAGVAKARKELAYPADLYLEGERAGQVQQQRFSELPGSIVVVAVVW